MRFLDASCLRRNQHGLLHATRTDHVANHMMQTLSHVIPVTALLNSPTCVFASPPFPRLFCFLRFWDTTWLRRRRRKKGCMLLEQRLHCEGRNSAQRRSYVCSFFLSCLVVVDTCESCCAAPAGVGGTIPAAYQRPCTLFVGVAFLREDKIGQDAGCVVEE